MTNPERTIDQKRRNPMESGVEEKTTAKKKGSRRKRERQRLLLFKTDEGDLGKEKQTKQKPESKGQSHLFPFEEIKE